MTKRLPEINILKHDKKDFAKKIKKERKRQRLLDITKTRDLQEIN